MLGNIWCGSIGTFSVRFVKSYLDESWIILGLIQTGSYQGENIWIGLHFLIIDSSVSPPALLHYTLLNPYFQYALWNSRRSNLLEFSSDFSSQSSMKHVWHLNLEQYSMLIFLLILVELGAAGFIFFDKSWKDVSVFSLTTSLSYYTLLSEKWWKSLSGNSKG